MRARRELVGHPVERSRDCGHLVAAVLGGTRRQVAAAEAFGRVLHLPEPPANRAEHDEGHHRHAHGEHAAADQAHRWSEFADDARERRTSWQDCDASDGLPGNHDGRELAAPGRAWRPPAVRGRGRRARIDWRARPDAPGLASGPTPGGGPPEARAEAAPGRRTTRQLRAHRLQLLGHVVVIRRPPGRRP